MNTTLRFAAAVALATPLACLATLATAAPPSSTPPGSSDRGLLGGPDVDAAAAEGRGRFGPGEGRMGPNERGERGARGARPGIRRFAMLAMAVRDAEPTPEQAASIRAYLGEIRERAQAFAKEHGEEMRKLVRVRRELVADGGDLTEVDAEILELRSGFVKAGEILENLQERLAPEQREKFRTSLEGQVRAAMERMREVRRGAMPAEPRRRGGRADGPAMDGAEGPRGGADAGRPRGPGRAGPNFGGSIEEFFEDGLLLEAMRRDLQGEGGRMRGGRPGGPEGQRRRGGDRPPLDLDPPSSPE